MSKLSIITLILGLLLISFCVYKVTEDNSTPTKETSTPTITENQHVIIDTLWTTRIVKSIKTENDVSTSYRYKYDWLNGKIKHQPKITSETKYYIVYMDGGIEETTKEKGMFYEKGDTIKTYSFVYK